MFYGGCVAVGKIPRKSRILRESSHFIRLNHIDPGRVQRGEEEDRRIQGHLFCQLHRCHRTGPDQSSNKISISNTIHSQRDWLRPEWNLKVGGNVHCTTQYIPTWGNVHSAILSSLIHPWGCIRKYILKVWWILTVFKSILPWWWWKNV